MDAPAPRMEVHPFSRSGCFTTSHPLPSTTSLTGIRNAGAWGGTGISVAPSHVVEVELTTGFEAPLGSGIQGALRASAARGQPSSWTEQAFIKPWSWGPCVPPSPAKSDAWRDERSCDSHRPARDGDTGNGAGPAPTASRTCHLKTLRSTRTDFSPWTADERTQGDHRFS